MNVWSDEWKSDGPCTDLLTYDYFHRNANYPVESSTNSGFLLINPINNTEAFTMPMYVYYYYQSKTDPPQYQVDYTFNIVNSNCVPTLTGEFYDQSITIGSNRTFVTNNMTDTSSCGYTAE